jgi:hypothetical protein
VVITLGPVNEAEEIEQLDGLAEEVRITRLQPPPVALGARRAPGGLPVRAAGALAAGGFMAGAALVGIVGRRQRRSRALLSAPRHSRLAGRRGRGGVSARRRPEPERLQIVGTRKLLIDVHLLGSPGPDH